MLKHRRFIIIAMSALSLLFIWVAGAWISFLYTPIITDEHGMKYTVREGCSMRAVIDDLYLQNIVKQPRLFKLLVQLKGVKHDLKAGEYLFSKGTTPPKMLMQIVTGSGMVYHAFMIIPGWNFQHLRDELLQNEHFHHTIQNMSDADIMKKLGQASVMPEGQFFPDTYFFVEGSSDFVILKRAFNAMQEKLNAAWLHHDPGLPYATAYDALIAASIIEKEANLETELPKIAGVLVNRLNKNMLLQFDPTVIYGVGSRYNGKIRREDLRDKNPYNTYVNKGLPPTPISMPSLAAIDAVMHPQRHDYYYFVARGDGSHQFSKYLVDHYKAVALAKKAHLGFFNYAITQSYLLKLFSQKMYTSS